MRRPLRYCFMALSLALLVALVGAACAPAAAPTPTPAPKAAPTTAAPAATKEAPAPAKAATPAAAKPTRTIKIGATIPVTGPMSAEWGPMGKKFTEEWVKMVNEQGGISVKEFNAKLPLELTVLDWFRTWVGYPPTASGILLGGGSAANLIALACAREALVGAMDDRVVAYVSDQAHSSLARAARAREECAWSETYATTRSSIAPTIASRAHASAVRFAAEPPPSRIPEADGG